MQHPFNNNNTVCLIIDIQERLCTALHEAEQFVAKSATFLQGIQALNLPCLLTEQYPKGLGKTLPAITDALSADTPCIEKTQFSADLPEVRQFLQEHACQNVIIIGAETHVCILQTALDLQNAGYQVYLPFECLTSRDPLNKNNALTQLTQSGAVVSNIESLLFALLRDAKHPAFKTISKLIV